MKMNIVDLKEAFPINQGAFDSEVDILNVSIDSRNQMNKGLFIPIKGERFDGHQFLKDAINNGAIACLWEEGRSLPEFLPNHFPVFFVKDTTQGLQHLSQYYLEMVGPIVIGITGSNGKTTTKDIVASILSTSYNIHKTEGNFNNHIGLPLSILSMEANCEVLILEMGMNNFGEISLLSKLAKPKYAIITNIGESHLENLGSREGIAKAKMEIIDGLKDTGCLILDGDEPLLSNVPSKIKCLRCGFDTNNDIRILQSKTSDNGMEFYIDGQKLPYSLSLIGDHYVKNACYAIALARKLNIHETEIRKGLKYATITGMRMEHINGQKGTLIINDAYNASPTSMKAAIETVKQLSGYSKKVLVLGDMLELGKEEEKLHRGVAKSVNHSISDVIVIGKRGAWIADELYKRGISGINIYSFKEKEDAKEKLKEMLSEETVILLKASRGMKLEALLSELT